MACRAASTPEVEQKPAQKQLAQVRHVKDNPIPITDAERALFAACFGDLINQVLAGAS